MTIGELRKIIEGLPDDMPIAVCNWKGSWVDNNVAAKPMPGSELSDYLDQNKIYLLIDSEGDA